MPKFIENATVTRKGLYVDGEEFPFYVANSVSAYASENELRTITVDLIVTGTVVLEGLDVER